MWIRGKDRGGRHAVKTAAVAAILLGLLSGLADTGRAGAETARPEADSIARQRGVCLVAGRNRPTDEALDRLVRVGVGWASLTPFGWQRRHDDPTLRMATGGRVWWGESDAGLADTIQRLKERGIRVTLKPHIWIRDRSNGKWRGEIAFATEAEWDAWWERYREFAVHYARLAEAQGVDLYCIGTELRSAVLRDPERWRALIADIRSVYGGKLTYSANWYHEFAEVPFWDALDYIGIQAYFPLADVGEDETVEELTAGWSRHLPEIERVQRRFGRPVLMTEVGYRSTRDAAAEPWQWRSGAERDDAVQARCYEALFRSFWDKPWFAGMYIWKWYSDDRMSNRRLIGFTPQGKQAERVLQTWYGGE